MDTYRQLILQIAIPKLTVNVCPPGVKKKIILGYLFWN
jgi:hypothetical protein